MSRAARAWILMVVLFTVFTLILTYPLVLNFRTSVFSDPDWTFDTYGSLYEIWWWNYADKHGLDWERNPLVAYPFGFDFHGAPVQTAIFYPMRFLTGLLGEVGAYNLFIILSYILAATLTALLVIRLTGSRAAGLVGGLIFAFCPNHSLQAFSHYSLAIIQWIPLYLISLFLLDRRPGLISGILTGASYSLVLLSNFYYGYFMAILTIIFIVFRTATRAIFPGADLRRRLLAIAAAAASAAILLAPSTWPMLKTALGGSKSAQVAWLGYTRPYSDLFTYAGRWYDYLLPSEYHPVWGNNVKRFLVTHFSSRHWSDKTLFLGFVPIVLAAIGAKRFWKKTPEARFLVIAFFSSILLSFAPSVGLGKIRIPMPSGLLYHVAPMFRFYSRFGFVANLAVAVLAGFGIASMMKRRRGHARNAALVTLCSCLILLEFAVVPPFRTVDLKPVPPVYEWLRSEPQDKVIVEYPLMRNIEERTYRYLWYQRLHGKRLVNGAQPGTGAELLRRKLEQITDPRVPAMLRTLGTDYVIIHGEAMRDETEKEIQANPALLLEKTFGETSVYRITAEPVEIIVEPAGFYQPETWPDGRAWQWMGPEAGFWVYRAPEAREVWRLRARATAFVRPRQLEIMAGEKLFSSHLVNAMSSPGRAQEIAFGPFILPPGESWLKLRAPEGADVIGKTLGTRDKRAVSIALGPLSETGEFLEPVETAESHSSPKPSPPKGEGQNKSGE